jgi:hypothetical protein
VAAMCQQACSQWATAMPQQACSQLAVHERLRSPLALQHRVWRRYAGVERLCSGTSSHEACCCDLRMTPQRDVSSRMTPQRDVSSRMTPQRDVSSPRRHNQLMLICSVSQRLPRLRRWWQQCSVVGGGRSGDRWCGAAVTDPVGVAVGHVPADALGADPLVLDHQLAHDRALSDRHGGYDYAAHATSRHRKVQSARERGRSTGATVATQPAPCTYRPTTAHCAPQPRPASSTCAYCLLGAFRCTAGAARHAFMHACDTRVHHANVRLICRRRPGGSWFMETCSARRRCRRC